MDNKQILIKKASGDIEAFSSEKLEQSLFNAGAEKDTIEKIVADIQQWIQPGVSTKKIYARAFSILRSKEVNSSLRYRLKQAIFELGPTGYPFEILIGELFQRMGYQTEVGVVLEGNCVTHEMDVVATNSNTQHLVECKFHKDQGKHVSVQVPLYVRSRVDDIVSKRKHLPSFHGLRFKGWVITNTRFSSDSIQYGSCSGLQLLAWNYPHGNGLKERLEEYKLYPVTLLKSLSIKEKQTLLNKGIVCFAQLKENLSVVDAFELKKTKYNNLLKELDAIGLYP